jgi:hypothetical protein
MPAPLRIILSESDDAMLSELRVATTVPYRPKSCASERWLCRVATLIAATLCRHRDSCFNQLNRELIEYYNWRKYTRF